MPTIRHRRATSAQWSSQNPILGSGEIGFEIDTNRFRIGDGLSNWLELTPFVDAEFMTSGGNPHASAGRELQAARRQSQFSWSGLDWVNVEGLRMRFSTSNGPAYMFLNLGLVVVNSTEDVTVEHRIVNIEQQRVVCYSTLTLPGLAGGFNSTVLPAINGRIPNGNPDQLFMAQTKVAGNYTVAYIIPDWLPDAAGDLYAIGA